MTTETKSPPKKKLIVFPQDKGGIGKSFVATLLYDYLSERPVKLKTFDLDHANSTFQRFVADAEFMDTDVDADKLAVLDKMVNALETVDVVLVDNRASGGTKILRYIEDSQLTKLQKELQFELIFVVVVLDDKDAISQISPCHRYDLVGKAGQGT
jgi:cellulose biosynthesis protein BcsQ